MTGVQVENLRRGATVLTDPLRAPRVRSEQGARGAEGTDMLAAGQGRGHALGTEEEGGQQALF